MTESNATFLLNADFGSIPTLDSIRKKLEADDIDSKVSGLKELLIAVQHGEDPSKLLMTVIRFCITKEDHELKKLLHLFWETVRKHDAEGKLKPEMILVCNALRNDLIHPNEYVRGSTLRFVCKIRDSELLGPLIPSIQQNVAHRHPYVRRNAVLAVYSVYKQFGAELLPDAPSDIEKFLEEERDTSARRNAFLMLFNCDMDRAVRFYINNVESASTFGDGFQLVVLELARRICRTDRSKKGLFIRAIAAMLEDGSPAVVFEAASSLVSLSVAPSAVRAAAGAYSGLLSKESDNNVKMIILERVASLIQRYKKVLHEFTMDVLRVLSEQNLELSQKAIDVALDLVSTRNVDELFGHVKKELLKTQNRSTTAVPSGKSKGRSKDGATAGSGASTPASTVRSKDPVVLYREMLVSAVHKCAVRFPRVAEDAVMLMCDLLSDASSARIAFSVRELAFRFPQLRPAIVDRLNDLLPEFTGADVYGAALWIIAQYSKEPAEISRAMQTIFECIGQLPLTDEGKKQKEEGDNNDSPNASSAEKGREKRGPVVLADGTYASQAAADTSTAEGAGGNGMPTLRKLLLENKYILPYAVCSALCRLALRSIAVNGEDSAAAKSATVDVLLVMAAILEYGHSSYCKEKIDQDGFERISSLMLVLGEPESPQSVQLRKALLEDSETALQQHIEWRDAASKKQASDRRKAASGMHVAEDEEEDGEERKTEEENGDDVAPVPRMKAVITQADDLLVVRQLRGRLEFETALDFDDDVDIGQATGSQGGGNAPRKEQLKQLTGLSDSVYVEAKVTVHDVDIVLDMKVLNRTDTTMTNLTVELAAMGDLKIVERPQRYTVGPGDWINVVSTVKLTSTESGHIFGTVVYNTSSSATTTEINLSEMLVDITDFMTPATLSEVDFREMWFLFEWENKLAINTNITNLREFVHHICKVSKMRCLTPLDHAEESGFLAVNLYSKSVFGENVLLNVVAEIRTVHDAPTIRGHMRVRSKTQAIALSLGDVLSERQKKVELSS